MRPFYETKLWEDWLSTLYRTGEVSLVDFAISEGWESLILREYHYESGRMGEVDCHEDMTKEEFDAEVERDMVHVRRQRILFQCLQYCYPQCPNCQGRQNYTPGIGYFPCPDCHGGILLPKEDVS